MEEYLYRLGQWIFDQGINIPVEDQISHILDAAESAIAQPVMMLMGRKSTIETMPEDILAQLQALLLDPRVTQLEVTHRINALLNAKGLEPVSKSAVNRYAQNFEDMTKDVAETDRLAALMLKELNITNQSNVAQATAETLRVMLLHFIPILRKSMQSEELSIKDMKVITGMLKDLTAGHERLETSATINEKRRREIEREAAQQAREQAAVAVGEAATARGLDADFARFLRESVLQGGV